MKKYIFYLNKPKDQRKKILGMSSNLCKIENSAQDGENLLGVNQVFLTGYTDKCQWEKDLDFFFWSHIMLSYNYPAMINRDLIHNLNLQNKITYCKCVTYFEDRAMRQLNMKVISLDFPEAPLQFSWGTIINSLRIFEQCKNRKL